MKLISTTVLLLLCTCFALHAQNLVNGSLEPKIAITLCTAGPVGTFNSNMGSAWSNGTYTTIFVNDNSCSSGAAVAGNNYTGIRYTFSLSAQDYNTLVLKLDAPLIKDTLYKITFNYKLDAGSSYVHSNAILIYGYTKDSMSKDSTAGSIGSISTATWKLDTLKIKPKVSNMQYIWLEAAYGGLGSVLAYLDDFKVLHSANNVQDVNIHNSISLYPNPVRGNATLQLEQNVSLPCKLDVYDVSGRTVLQQLIRDRKTTINTSDLNGGIYFMRLIDDKGQRCVQKLIVE